MSVDTAIDTARKGDYCGNSLQKEIGLHQLFKLELSSLLYLASNKQSVCGWDPCSYNSSLLMPWELLR